MINCGIIGFGRMGNIRAKAIEESGRGRVAAVWDAHPVDTMSYKVASSDEALIKDHQIDAVFICTPNYRIVPLCKAALQAGKHVFAEKPPAFNAREVEEVIAVEKASGCKLMYGFNHRHHASVQTMKQIVDSGEMGRILWMRGRYGKEVDESFFQGWRAKKELAGGGIMLDQGIHMLDLMLYFGGGFDEVQAMVSNLYWKIDGVEDNVFANFRSSKTHICASLHSTMTQWRYIFSMEIFMESGAMILNGLKTTSGAYGDEDLSIKRNRQHSGHGTFDSEERFIYHSDTSWASEVGHFLESIQDNKSVTLGNSTDALIVMRVIDQIYGRS